MFGGVSEIMLHRIYAKTFYAVFAMCLRNDTWCKNFFYITRLKKRMCRSQQAAV